MKTLTNLRSGKTSQQNAKMPDKIAIQNMGGYNKGDTILVEHQGGSKQYKFTGYDIKALN